MFDVICLPPPRLPKGVIAPENPSFVENQRYVRWSGFASCPILATQPYVSLFALCIMIGLSPLLAEIVVP